MEEEFKELYNYIVQSEDEEKMRVLGQVTKSMMHKFIEGSPKQAREYLDMLQSVKWNNYVTTKEAEEIVAKMSPEPMWSRSMWDNIMSNLDAKTCEEPYYNDNALYVTMCMISSDSGETLKGVIESLGAAVMKDTLFGIIHKLALDKLKDKDGVFNIRWYFDL